MTRCFLFLMVVAILLIIPSCSSIKAENNLIDTLSSTISSCEENTKEGEQSDMKFIQNSETKELINDFTYLWAVDENKKMMKKCKSSDIISFYLKKHINTQSREWLVDLKSGKLYYGIAPRVPYFVSNYGYSRDLSKDEIKKINIILKDNVNLEWYDDYTGENKGTGSSNWFFYSEYKNGAVLRGKGIGMSSFKPHGLNELIDCLTEMCKV